MAAGTTIKHKRKAGAFAGGELSAGEFGVDVTNSHIYFSIDGTSVTLVATGTGTVVTTNSPIANDFARFTDPITIEGRTVSQTKTDLSLNNVTNENKATMFTDSALTGTPTAPTASTGTNTTQIATTAFVQTAVASLDLGLGKRSTVRAKTTGNVTISTALNNGDSVDGVTLVTGDLVLVASQTAPAQNGIYVVGVTPVRSSEFDTFDDHAGAIIVVQEGSVGDNTIWICTTNVGGVLGTNAIAFTKLVIAGELLATNNLSDVNDVPTAATNLGLGTSNSPQFAGVNIGHASDTTITRTGAGDIAVEGNQVFRAGGTDVPVADGGTGASSASGARTNLGLIIGSDVAAASHTHAATDIVSGDLATARMQTNVVAAVNAGGGTINNVGVTVDGGSI